MVKTFKHAMTIGTALRSGKTVILSVRQKEQEIARVFRSLRNHFKRNSHVALFDFDCYIRIIIS